MSKKEAKQKTTIPKNPYACTYLLHYMMPYIFIEMY